jgi:hypothetical protein
MQGMSSDVFRRCVGVLGTSCIAGQLQEEPLKAQEVSNMLYGMQGHEQ